MRGTVHLVPDEPVNVGVIEFLPDKPGPSARALIEPGGEYTLSTFGDRDGALPGDYTVIVSQPQLAAGALFPAPEEHIAEHHGGVADDAHRVPDRFNKPTTSGLRASVTEGENRIDFVLSP